MRLQVVLHAEEGGGYSVTIPALPGCYTFGITEAEALANAKLAATAHLRVGVEDLRLSHRDLMREIEV